MIDRILSYQTLVVIVLVALGVMLAHALRTPPDRHGLHYDEAFTLVAATGHLGVMERTLQRDTVSTATLHALLRPDSLRSWSDISQGLSEHDIHPPLFFWLLHHWLQLTHGATSLERVPNMLFALATAAGVFLLCMRLSGGRHRALGLLLGLLWLLHPGTLAAVLFLRQYALLTLFCVLGLLLLAGVETERHRRFKLVLLFGVLAAGVLTQYQFVLVFGVVTVHLLVHFFRQGRRRDAWLVPVLALVSFVIVHLLVGSLAGLAQHPMRWMQSADGGALLQRVQAVVAGLYGLLLPPVPVMPWGLLFLAAVLVLLLVRRGAVLRTSMHVIAATLLPAAALLVMCVVVAGPYLVGATPLHAMGGRYVLMLAPLVMVLLFQVLAEFGDARPVRMVVAGYVILVVALGGGSLRPLDARADDVTEGLRALDGSERVMISGADRRVVLPSVRLLPTEGIVLLAGNSVPADAAINRFLSTARRAVYLADASGWSGAADTSHVLSGITRAGFHRVESMSYKTRRLHVFVRRGDESVSPH